MKLNTLTIDSETVYCEAFTDFIKKLDRVSRSFQANTLAKALEIIKQQSIDIVLIDPCFHETRNLTCLTDLSACFSIGRVIVLTNFEGKFIVEYCLRVGVGGYLTKSVKLEELEKAIDLVSKNERYVENRLHRMLQQSFYSFDASTAVEISSQERKLAKFLVKGLTSKEIADAMCLSTKTINSYRENLLQKTKTKNAAELVSFLYRNGLLSIAGEGL